MSIVENLTYNGKGLFEKYSYLGSRKIAV